MSSSREEIFVFVVCGTANYLDELHYSMHVLKVHCPDHRIIVVTDSSRNDYPVRHSEVIDIETPGHFNNHKASIFLKTSLGKTLPEGPLYCYLDTDLVAVSGEAGSIFNEFVSVVCFAPDDRRLREFSPFAVNCSCVEKRRKKKLLLETLDKYQTKDPELSTEKERLQERLNQLNKNLIRRYLSTINFIFSGAVYHLDDEFYFDKHHMVWKTSNHQPVMYDFDSVEKELRTREGLWYHPESNTWFTANGEDVISNECDHLAERISSDLGVIVREKDWQHWNGGLFLFDDSGREFLDSWHQKTMRILNDPNWVVRDQGTLVATAWEFGMQNTDVLAPEWNYLPDFKDDTRFSNDGKSLFNHSSQKWVRPKLVHFYQRYGDDDFALWNWVVGQLQSGVIPPGHIGK